MVRQRSAKPSFPSSNLGGTSKRRASALQMLFFRLPLPFAAQEEQIADRKKDNQRNHLCQTSLRYTILWTFPENDNGKWSNRKKAFPWGGTSARTPKNLPVEHCLPAYRARWAGVSRADSSPYTGEPLRRMGKPLLLIWHTPPVCP